MNFLSGGCIGIRYGRVTYWTTPFCKGILKTVSIVPVSRGVDSIAALRCHNARTSDALQSKLCTGNVRAVSGWMQWTQVRFKKDCPKDCGPQLHRDLQFPNFDPYRKDQFKDVRKTTWGEGFEKPGHAYVISFFGLLCATYGLKSELTHFISYMAAAADVLAMASIEVDLSKIAPGACLSYKWRGKPLFVKHRTPGDIDLEAKTNVSSLRDPQSPDDRTVKPEWLVVIGICTHLGCVPIPNSGDWPGGFYCPCHGSHYDNVGRARKGPAPLNLEVPPYKFLSDTLVLIG